METFIGKKAIKVESAVTKHLRYKARTKNLNALLMRQWISVKVGRLYI